jgi:murein DD-endopeptidase MepM/ murein hydrolase activator NlpD
MVPRYSLISGSLLLALLGLWLLGAGPSGFAGSKPDGSASGADGAGSGVHGSGGPDSAQRAVGALPSTAVLDAVRSAFPVSPPYRERGRFGPAEERVFGYVVTLMAGDTLRVTVTDARADAGDAIGADGGTAAWTDGGTDGGTAAGTVASADGGTVASGDAGPATNADAGRSAFRLDAFRTGAAPSARPIHLAGSEDAGILTLTVDVPGDVVVLLHGGASGATFVARIERSGGLVFPVAGRGPGDVMGHFLDLRDGGRRLHHGVDIAAPAGNPVRAVAAGIIQQVETTPVGGLTIRLVEDRTGHVHYYAHLAAAFVAPGQRVVAGQTIGGVGNTGNARNTPPHLHYAVFDGPDILDPMKRLRPTVLPFAADSPSDLLGSRGRIRINGAALRDVPTPFGPATSLDLDQPVQVLAETGGYLRVRVDGQQGYLAAWVVGP